MSIACAATSAARRACVAAVIAISIASALVIIVAEPCEVSSTAASAAPAVRAL